MGWLFTHQTQSQLITTLIQPRSSENASFEVREHHLSGDVLWSLVRLTPQKEWRYQINAGESLVFIRCDLLRSTPDGWGYKALEEGMHPYYYSCPLHYLDLAPEQSADWREGVRKFHADQAQQNSIQQSGCNPQG